MKNNIKKIVKYSLGPLYAPLERVINALLFRLGKRSYSQEGEDLILARFFEKQKIGFYVDVGAHHPYRFSNTCFFYRRGWSGLNIDAMPGSMEAFRKTRSRDINLEVGVLRTKEKVPFFVFDDAALNGFWPDRGTAQKTNPGYNVLSEILVDAFPLSDIFNKHLSPNQEIDFLSIDAEGRDMDVVSSNDWVKYRPKVVVIELHGRDLHSLISTPMCEYMEERGYIPYAKSFNSVFFLEKQFRNFLLG